MVDIKTASLTVLGGPLAGEQCTLPESGTLTIGSAPGSSLYLDLPAVSPYHARVVVEAGRITVHDTGSSRTVHVNDNAIGAEGTELRNGDILWLGSPGDEDVVMLQCILPKRAGAASVTPPPPLTPALSSGATPTPEIETVALWATETDASGAGALAEAVAEAAAEGLYEPAPVAPAAAADADFVDDVSVPATTEEPEIVAPIAPPLPVSFVEETPVEAAVEAAAEADPPLVEGAEDLAEVAPTLLMSSADEVAEAVEPGYRETVTLDSPPAFTPEMFAASAPVDAVEATPVLEPARTLEARAPAQPPAPAPAAAPVEPAPAAGEPQAAAAARAAAWQTSRPRGPSASQRLSPSASQRTSPSASQRTSPSASQRTSPSASQRQRARSTSARAEPALSEAGEAGTEAASSRRPLLLAVGGFVGVLALAGGGFLAWRSFGARTAQPAATPTPIAGASEPAPPQVAATPVAEPAATPMPEIAAPEPNATATAPPPVETPPAQLAPTPVPRPTPTPRAAPTAAAAATPPPGPAGPSAEQLRAQQTAAQVQALLGQAEAAAQSRQYDAALSHLDGALRLEPGNARSTSLRSDVTQRRELARRRFVAGRTVVDSEKTRKEKERGGLVGFDTDAKTPDFLGRIEFEMSPAQGVEANDAWTLRVFVVNQGGKPIRVQGVTVGTTINGAAAGAPVTPSAREIAPQQRVLVAESTGTWREGTTAWVAEATLTAPRNETLKNTLTWR